MDSQKKFPVMTEDGVRFEIDAEIAMEIETLNNSNNSEASVIPLPNVSSDSLVKIMDFIKMNLEFKENRVSDSEKLKNSLEYLAKLDDDEITKLTLAANNLNLKELLDLSAQSIANRISDKNVDYIRNFFKVNNDFTPEEEAKIREEIKNLQDHPLFK